MGAKLEIKAINDNNKNYANLCFDIVTQSGAFGIAGNWA
jgi:hypothetical protein